MQRVLQAQTLAGLRRRVVIRDFIRLQRVDHIEDANAGLEITTGQRGWIGAPVDSAVVRLVTERTVANGIGSAQLGVFLQLDLQLNLLDDLRLRRVRDVDDVNAFGIEFIRRDQIWLAVPGDGQRMLKIGRASCRERVCQYV